MKKQKATINKKRKEKSIEIKMKVKNSIEEGTIEETEMIMITIIVPRNMIGEQMEIQIGTAIRRMVQQDMKVIILKRVKKIKLKLQNKREYMALN